jgi:hypothetical protein
MPGLTRRAAITLALALCLLGCGSPVPSGEPVVLLTGVRPFDEDECSRDFYVASELLADPQYGTALASFLAGDRVPVMWPPGFTGRRVGPTVEVADTSGNVVATTGQSYSIRGNMLFALAEGDLSTYKRGVVLSPIGEDMLYACGLVRPDATSHPADVPAATAH